MQSVGGQWMGSGVAEPDDRWWQRRGQKRQERGAGFSDDFPEIFLRVLSWDM
uniref:Uncharacterized protein n=1 Tax=Rhizophora mucronata TaxID=61149 RepID=A0A2P2N5G2_RHIMU